jgi:large subunit ribosomal protein L6
MFIKTNMSRIVNFPIIIPINVFINNNDNNFKFQGLLGILNQKFDRNIKMEIKKNVIFINRCTNSKLYKSLHGLYNIMIKNLIIGVSNGFTKKLELIGVGYKANIIGKYLNLSIGYSHNIIMEIPNEVSVRLNYVKVKYTVIILTSLDKQLLGIVAAKIRSFRKPDPYKGKGIKYVEEEIRRKTGKSA